MLDRYEEFKQRTLEVVEKDLIQEVDGFYYYYPTGSGCWSADSLRAIADELDRRNRDWNEYINEHLNREIPSEHADGWKDYGTGVDKVKF